MKRRPTILASSIALCFAGSANADDLSDLKAQLKALSDNYQAQIQALTKQVQVLEQRQAESERAHADSNATLRAEIKKPIVVQTAEEAVAPGNPMTRGIPVWSRPLVPIEFYGSLDIGLYNISNFGGHHRLELYSSYSLLGIRGSHKLDDGLIAFYDLVESVQINNGQFRVGVGVSNGAVSSPAVLFDRGAYIGLASPTWGALSAGRQYDFLFGPTLSLDSVIIQGGLAGGFQGFAAPKGPPPAVDVRYGGAIYDNAVKWVKSTGPLSGGLMVAIGSSNGASPNGGAPDPAANHADPNSDRMYSAFLKYAMPDYSVGIGYTYDNFTTTVFANKAVALKGQYILGRWLLLANYGVGKEHNATQPGSHASGRPLELATNYAHSENWLFGGGVGKNWATTRAGQSATVNQYFAAANYLIDANTRVYLRLVRNHTSDPALVPATFGVPGAQTSPSTTDSVSAMVVGMKYSF